MKRIKYTDFEKIISPERSYRYVNACSNDRQQAMTLYRYNIKLSQKDDTFAPMDGYWCGVTLVWVRPRQQSLWKNKKNTSFFINSIQHIVLFTIFAPLSPDSPWAIKLPGIVFYNCIQKDLFHTNNWPDQHTHHHNLTRWRVRLSLRSMQTLVPSTVNGKFHWQRCFSFPWLQFYQ